jgi:hypothetical protein
MWQAGVVRPTTAPERKLPMTTPRLTVLEFIKAHSLTIESELALANPYLDGMPEGSQHYSVTITGPLGSMTVPYSVGPGIIENAGGDFEPELSSVLDSLASDASTYENTRDFEDWCSEFGYDTDSRKAEATWRAVQDQSNRLRKVLGSLTYESLLWNTERE